MRKRKLLWGGVPALVLLVCTAVQAAPQKIVITATRNATGEDRVPAGVTVLTPKDWEKTGALTVRDALERVPGLNVVEGGMTGNKVSLRGMGNGSTLILVDGRRLAGEDSPQTMNVYELNRLNLDRVRRIEVVRLQPCTAVMPWVASSRFSPGSPAGRGAMPAPGSVPGKKRCTVACPRARWASWTFPSTPSSRTCGK